LRLGSAESEIEVIMARIGSSITGIERRLLDSLALANAQVTLANYRMATGHKINFPSDSPSAFVALSGLQSQLNDVTATLTNVTAAGSIVSQTQTALDGIDTQLDLIRTELLKDEGHTLTPAQRAESQAIIDAAVTQINSLAGTSINGKTTLAGGADYIYSGRNTSQVADVVVRNKVAPSATISGTVASTATQADLTYTGNASNQVTAAATFTLTGERGSQVISVTTGEALSTVAAQVNQYSHDTGITAAVDEIAHTLTFTSVDYGSSAIVDIDVSSGTFVVTGGDGSGHDAGVNASAVINGQTISSSSNNVNGNRFTVSENGMTFEIEFQEGFTGAFDTITVEGDALKFALSTSLGNTSALAITPVFAANLGGPSGTLDQLFSGGSLSGLGNNTSQAIRVVDEALGKITRVNGNVDGFYNAAITSSSNLLTDMQTQLGDSIDSIDLVDDEEETAISDYYQALADNAVSALTIVNQQRMSIVLMIQDIAGLT
jgi:flagellin-like hook-associated protein FlgL